MDISILKHGKLSRGWPYVVAAALIAALPPSPALMSLEEKGEFLGLKAFGCVVGLIVGWLLTGNTMRFRRPRSGYLALGAVSSLYLIGMVVYFRLLPDAPDFFYMLCGLAFAVSTCVGFVLYVASAAFEVVASRQPPEK